MQRRWIEVGLILLFWISVAALLLGREWLNPHQGASGLREGEALASMLSVASWAIFTPIIFWLSIRFSPERIKWPASVISLVGLGVAIAVMVDLLDHWLWNMFVIDAPRRTYSVLYILDNFHFLIDFFIYLGILVAGFARTYFLRFQNQQKEAIQLRMDTAQLQTRLAEARLSALRMQINPHFLFNALHVISDHFEENPRTARRMIARLSDILRYTFEGTETAEVPLHQEMQFLDGYLDIQRYRFEDRLVVKTDVANDVQHALVPTLILQPLVENAIKHGVNQIEGQGKIEINAWREAETLHMRIADNGPGASGKSPSINGNAINGSAINGKAGTSSGIGLRNTQERLKMLYGDAHVFSAKAHPEGGFEVKIAIPFHTSNDYQLSAVEVSR